MKSFTIGFNRLGIDLDTLNSTGYTTCPKCSENRKNTLNRKSKVLKVYPNTGYYQCHHCEFKGRVDSNEWIEQQHGIETGLIQPTNNKVPKVPQMPTIKPFHFNSLPANAIEWLNDRGISKETAEACKVAYNKGCLCFNYYKGAEVIGAKYRKLDSKFFWQHAGCKKYLYGLNDIENEETIIIVEGEMDKLAFYEAGITNVVSVSQGAPNEGQEIGTKLQCLDNSIDYIKDKKRVILACDNDPNGNYLTKVLIERFGADRCATIEMPEGCKDANDVLITFGKDLLVQLVEQAKDTPITGVRTLQQAKGKMLDIFLNGYKKGVDTGIREMKGHFSFYKSWWYLWHGIPNSGKSAFVHFVMLCMSVKHEWKWAVFSPEHYPEEDFYIDLVELLVGRSIDMLNQTQFEKAMEFIGEHFFFVYPEADDMSNTTSNVLEKIKELKLSKGIDGFLIDPYNQLIRDSGENIDRYLERTLMDVDRLGKTHNLVGNIVAHPRTLYKDKGEQDYRKPTPYEIAGGAMWYNKAYGIVNIHRPFNQSDKFNTMVEIDVQKIKSHKRAGKPASLNLHFDRSSGWYRSVNGQCVLEGVFEQITGGEQTNLDLFEGESTSFIDKMNADKGTEYTLDDCPF